MENPLEQAYRPQNFVIHELVPPEVFHDRGERAWELLDPRAVFTLQQLRNRFGKIRVNDWYWNGKYKESGLRTFDTETGATLSQHKFGRAFDCKPHEVAAKAMYAYVLEHENAFPHLTTVEDIEATPTWLHIDVRNNATPGIRVVKP